MSYLLNLFFGNLFSFGFKNSQFWFEFVAYDSNRKKKINPEITDPRI